MKLELARAIPREIRRAQSLYRRYGLIEVIAKAGKLPIVLGKSRWGYALYRDRYPYHLIFIAGLAKSGSTWLADMLADLPGFIRYQPAEWTASLTTEPHQDFYPGMLSEVKRRLAIVKGHTPGNAENAAHLRHTATPYLVTVRDPRDQIISGYWYLRNRPNHPAHGLALSLTLNEFLRHELNPATAQIERGDWIRGWLEHRDAESSIVVRYEDVLADTKAELAKVLTFLKFNVSTPKLDDIVARNSFKRKAGRDPGTEDTRSFYRKGIAGEWKELYSAEHKQLAELAFEDIIEALGYEPTEA